MYTDYRELYEPFRIDHLIMKNRIVRSAVFEYGANHGKISDAITEHYKETAAGGSGLIISGMHAVTPGGGIGDFQVHTTYDSYKDDLSGIVDQVHEYQARFIVELQHCGHQTAPKEGYDRFAVSDRESDGVRYHEMTGAERVDLIKAYQSAAVKCKAAGCDGIQIHASHGYLLNSFLSPYFNHRTDEYGGPIENRARLVFEIYDAIRKVVGTDFVIGIKLPCSDRVNPSITLDECIWVCQQLERKGLDFVEISSGIDKNGGNESFSPVIRGEDTEAPFAYGAEAVAKVVNIPVISVCGHRNPNRMAKLLRESSISALSLARPLIREPDLPNRWMISPDKPACISCDRCFGSKGIISCQLTKNKEMESKAMKKILIINGSPRMNGNTRTLAEAFASGARAAGHEVQFFDAVKANFGGCHADRSCEERGACGLKDEAQDMHAYLRWADMVVFASPVYWNGFTSQIKRAVDRLYPYGFEKGRSTLTVKEAFLISAAATPTEDAFDGIKADMDHICNILSIKNKGSICCPGLDGANDIQNKTEYIKAAVEAGLLIDDDLQEQKDVGERLGKEQNVKTSTCKWL